MLERCYSKHLDRKPTYEGVTVCDDWLVFSNFKIWMEKQDWKGKDLDKDIIDPTSKLYSPDTCAFVPRYINTLLNTKQRLRGEYPLGVHKRKPGKDMVNDYSKPFVSEGFKDGSRKLLGVFASPMDAHRAWQQSKILAIREALLTWKSETGYDVRVARSLIKVADKIEQEFLQGKETTNYD